MGIYIQCLDNEGHGCEVLAVEANSIKEAEELFIQHQIDGYVDPTEEDIQEERELHEARKEEGYIVIKELALTPNKVQDIWENLS